MSEQLAQLEKKGGNNAIDYTDGALWSAIATTTNTSFIDTLQVDNGICLVQQTDNPSGYGSLQYTIRKNDSSGEIVASGEIVHSQYPGQNNPNKFATKIITLSGTYYVNLIVTGTGTVNNGSRGAIFQF